MAGLRIFGVSVAVTAAAMVAGYLHGGPTAMLLLAALALLEVSLSFDNAVVNASVLRQLSPFWQRMFLTIGIVIAVFGTRLVFPLVIVWLTTDLDPLAGGAPGSPGYQHLITAAHPQIAAFGGMFLLMVFLDFAFHDRDVKWLTWVERPLARIGRTGQQPVALAGALLLLIGAHVTDSGADRAQVLTAGVVGLVAFLVVTSLAGVLAPPGRGAGRIVGRAGLVVFLYLETLDGAFSLDGVTGAFAITADPVIIALGLGLIGAVFVRSITVYLVRHDVLERYVYLEHGAHWAIGALAVILLLSVDQRFRVPEVVTALVGVVVIGAATGWSMRSRRRSAPGPSERPPYVAG
ncbi:DUF475 domain-containing protein [Mycobacterium sp.]|uniref:DUF475 domain-containing protein n=1 Tax=Mycobacterium sp. TaxID=1785 RepID=UPI0012773274|nr:DUF475 domain-containing protein [Mycobacterium sp.]KAA8970446.1 MAG: DUF475 domain-containing protein [Mycobacterium sp.]